jgi:hypothetical protein
MEEPLEKNKTLTYVFSVRLKNKGIFLKLHTWNFVLGLRKLRYEEFMLPKFGTIITVPIDVFVKK